MFLATLTSDYVHKVNDTDEIKIRPKNPNVK